MKDKKLRKKYLSLILGILMVVVTALNFNIITGVEEQPELIPVPAGSNITLYNPYNFTVIPPLIINEFCFNATDPYAVWMELYNPSDYPANLTHYRVWTSMVNTLFPWGASSLILNESQVNGTILEPHGYLILTPDIQSFCSYWNVSTDIHVISYFGVYYWASARPIIRIGMFSSQPVVINNQTIYGLYDEIVPYSITALNHSFARYRGGYDTDNFANDFYDEPYPTPGYENHWEKPKLDIIHSPNSRNVTLYWNYTVNPDIRKYNLLVSSLPSFPQNATNTIEILDTNISSYEFTDLLFGKHYFKLRVYNSTGTYAESNVIIIPQPPFPPVNLTTTLSDSKVKLTWEPPLNDGNAAITTYKIYRGTSENSLEFIASVNGSVTEYLDSNVTKGEKYYYAVSAVNPVGESNLSEIVSIEIPKEKEPVPSIGFAGIIGVIGIGMLVRYMKKRRKG